MTEDELFKEWKKSFEFSAFISDGIINRAIYERPHVLFVLRDMNCGSSRDLRQDIIRDGSGWKTWNNAARWAAALLDGEDEYPRDMPSQRRSEILSRTAIVNLKKEGGTSRADGVKLKKAASEQKGFILRQIEICEPDIILCCGLSNGNMEGNAALLKEYVFNETGKWENFQSMTLDRQWWYYYTFLNGRWIPVISFCHPQTACLGKARGHDGLFEPLYRDMLYIRSRFLKNGI